MPPSLGGSDGVGPGMMILPQLQASTSVARSREHQAFPLWPLRSLVHFPRDVTLPFVALCGLQVHFPEA